MASLVTVVSVTGPKIASAGLGLAPNQQVYSVEFQTTSSIVDGTAFVTLDSLGSETVNAWLTDSVGPSITVANVFATSTFSTPSGTTSNQQYAAITGINIGPGTYYLTLEGYNEPNLVGWDTTSAPVTSGPGTYVSSIFAGETAPFSFGPSGNFSPLINKALLFNVTTSVPEPGAGGLLTIGLVSLFSLQTIRRRQNSARPGV